MLFLDEIIVDLDVLVCVDLMVFLKFECDERGVIIIYVIYIFDGFEFWFIYMVSFYFVIFVIFFVLVFVFCDKFYKNIYI